MNQTNLTNDKLTVHELKNYLEHLYIMYFRKGLTPNVTRIFHCPGDLNEARIRAQAHCQRLPDHRLSLVLPLVTDLDDFEQKYGKAPTPNPLLNVMQEAQKL